MAILFNLVNHTRTWCEDVALEDLDDGIALQRVREEHAHDEGDVDEHRQYGVLRDRQHHELLDVLAVTQVANQTEGAEDDADEVDADVEEVREQVTVALHARLNRDQLHDRIEARHRRGGSTGTGDGCPPCSTQSGSTGR